MNRKAAVTLIALTLVVPMLGADSCSDTSDSSSSKKDEASSESLDKARAEKAWRVFISRRAKADARAVGAEIVKLEPEVREPMDYGLGVKQAVATAYAEVAGSGSV